MLHPHAGNTTLSGNYVRNNLGTEAKEILRTPEKNVPSHIFEKISDLGVGRNTES